MSLELLPIKYVQQLMFDNYFELSLNYIFPGFGFGFDSMFVEL